jgi:beta-glucosidase
MTAKQLVSQMTLEEKASLCTGKGFWNIKGIERLCIPSIMVSDGPHGLRKQIASDDHLGLNDSIPAVCFPTAAGLACSFDRDMMRLLGEALGDECQAEDVAILLGPAINIKRSPLCGRNFEYFSEDPYLTGELAAAYIDGVQSKNVGVSLKHFAVNNQEHRRMTVNVSVDERTLREIYLTAFEIAVKKAKPWTVMCSYNKLGGTYASENKKLLCDILRDEWGFEGFTMTDWGACNDHVSGVMAGLDLEMPSTSDLSDKLLVKAVREGKIPESAVIHAAERIINIVARYSENRDKNAVFDRGVHHHLARRIARESMVLLKNNDNLLPIRGSKKVAFIGKFAMEPRFQGGGSSHINASEVLSAMQAVRSVHGGVTYAQGYDTNEDTVLPEMISEAVQAAKESNIAVLFLGLPDSFESEGYDRTHMRLPNCQSSLLEAVTAVQPNTVVVLHNGSPVEMPWSDKVPAILEAYLGGQAQGGAVVDVLFGAANPCGKLAESFPLKLEDNPSYLYFPGDKDLVEYREGIYVGYRYYDTKQMDVRFPFGHGLSYTTFAYSNLRLSTEQISDGENLQVSVDVTNTGSLAGKEIVQLYVASGHKGISRPEKELKQFVKVSLNPGETKAVTITLDRRAFAYYEIALPGWHVENGAYSILIGASSRDIRLKASVEITGSPALPCRFTMDSTLGDVMDAPHGKELVDQIMQGMQSFINAADEGPALSPEMIAAMMRDMPLHTLITFSEGKIDKDMLYGIIRSLNGEA